MYLSASYARKREICAVAAELRRRGHLVASTWHDAPGDSDDVGAPNAGELARQDLVEICHSDVFCAFTDGYYTRAGHQVEFGAAAVLGLRLVLVGPVEHHFHRLPGVEHFDAAADLLRSIGGVG